jgi:Ni,Fe-hydrogenase maturation factor
MIHILFPPGGFGSTLEYAIRRFTKEFETINAIVSPTGSMHTYNKENHPYKINLFDKNQLTKITGISTPVYPCLDASAETTIKKFIELITSTDKVIFIEIKDIKAYERNFLFHFNKIDYFNICQIQYKQWNKQYQSVNDMHHWELREALSLTHSDISAQMLSAGRLKQSNWLTITTDQILFDFVNTFKKIINYLELTLENNNNELEEFYQYWYNKQQYVIDYQTTVDLIVEKITAEEKYSYDQLNLVQESLIQFRLRLLGKELKCYRLDIFPTNTLDFKNIIV